ncbi:unnamed protein product [[Candida] boidinii]|nr:unnamed protein product [[Candida] boidinii]
MAAPISANVTASSNSTVNIYSVKGTDGILYYIIPAGEYRSDSTVKNVNGKSVGGVISGVGSVAGSVVDGVTHDVGSTVGAVGNDAGAAVSNLGNGLGNV